MAMSKIDKEIHLTLLRYLAENPQVSQRELAEHLGISLGKTNYCLKALVEKGLVKARNFKNSADKRAYLYLLTPSGFRAKAEISVRFLQRKIAEHEALHAEIEQLRRELENDVAENRDSSGVTTRWADPNIFRYQVSMNGKRTAKIGPQTHLATADTDRQTPNASSTARLDRRSI